MATREPNSRDSENQPYLDAIDEEINNLCRTIETTQILNPPKKRSQNDWKRLAERGYLAAIERDAARGDEGAVAMLEVNRALENLRRALPWPEATLGQVSQFVYYCFEDCWKTAVSKRINRRR